LQTYASIGRLNEIMTSQFTLPDGSGVRTGLEYELALVARMIEADFGARIYYVSISGFDTHGSQREGQDGLLTKLARAIDGMFAHLRESGHAERVLLMTFSEFGRRVRENGSNGTDHGAGSNLFVAGPAAKGGPIGEHPSLEKLDSGDLVAHTDFRRVYATLLDEWLGCDSRRVLGERFAPLKLLSAKAG
jgi:uncharacterized protein (DUF1501 family)